MIQFRENEKLRDKMAKVEPFELFYDKYEKWFKENRYAYLSELEAVRHFIPKNSNCGDRRIEAGKKNILKE